MNYTTEIIELIDRERTKGLTWADVAKIVSEVYGERVTGNAVRKGFSRFLPDEQYDADHGVEVLIKARRSQIAASASRSELRKVLDTAIGAENVLEQAKKIYAGLKDLKIERLPAYNSARATHNMTVEALFSDLQIGKKSPDFSVEIAIKRMKAYTDALIFKIRQHQKSGYNVEKIVLVLLGDIIESMDKAVQKGDAMSCEVDTPEQIRLAILHLFKDVIVPLYQLNIPLHIIGIPGNHDHTGPGMKMFKAGLNQLSWVIYKELELLTEVAKMKDVTWDITEGIFTTYDYYGQIAVYEHGYGITPYCKNMLVRVSDRTRQLGTYATYFRMGDKHSITRFIEDTLIVNGAFFGSTRRDRGEEYSSVLGFSSQAAQLVLFHVPRKPDDRRNTVYDSFQIQLGHVT
jgi:hypothetical protein